MHISITDSNHGSSDFTVMIVATGPLRNGLLVHAVAVSQPVQSWTVIRSHDDFNTVSDSLRTFLPGITPCPPSMIYHGDMSIIENSRNELQNWLHTILHYPGARESPEVRNFLTLHANMIPPQFAEVAWVNFPSSQTTQFSQGDTLHQNHHHHHHTSIANNLDDMEMADMFQGDDEGTIEDDDDDPEDYISRYIPVNEPITREEEMDLMAFASEIEMVEDIGSLAQSLGASHLGRSLQLQAERNQTTTFVQSPLSPESQGVKLATPVQAKHKHGGEDYGGLSNVMEKAQQQSKVPGLGDSFHQKRPISAPKLDSFRLVKVIGIGSFGKVYLVKENKTGEMFALKVLRKDNIIKRNQVEHTKTERSVLGYVKHPFIVGLNMAFQSKDKLYFVLDYCAGGELFFQLGKQGKFPEPRARFYAAEIILAISYVHSLDIIYRDLKPENVLLDAKGHVRLTDFGLSKEGISSSSSGANSFCGTPEYLAPEILNRQGHGRAVDWWSLGALLYEMLTGLPPFYCQDREKLFEKIRKGELPYPASLSRSAKSLLRGLLTRDPTQRLGSGPRDAEDIKCHEFFHEIDWDKLARGEITPPWAPNITGSMDTSQFDKEFTSMPVSSPQSLQLPHGFGSTPAENPFEGFTFTDRTLMGPGS